jgi:hypothetical protein
LGSPTELSAIVVGLHDLKVQRQAALDIVDELHNSVPSELS